MNFFNEECRTIYETVNFYNEGERGENRIPESDIIIRDLANTLTISEDRVNDYLHALRDAHYIFIMNIAKEDPDRKILGLDGYVIASKEIISELLTIHDAELHQIYKKEKQRDKSTEGILKEMLPQMNVLNNTSIGKNINIISMLREFDHFLENHPEEFSEEFREPMLEDQLKTRKLIADKKIILPDEKVEDDLSDYTPEGEFSESAKTSDGSDNDTDSPFIEEYQTEKMILSFDKALQIYGLKFIVRFYFRQNKYTFVEELVRQNKYFDLRDLKFIRETLKSKMKDIYVKNRLSLHKSEIFRLDRTLNQAIRKYTV